MLTQTDLLASEIVANAAMNRGRGLSGVNSYDRELRFDIAAFLRERARARGRAVWLDACCGEGRALHEAGAALAGEPIQILGVDLMDASVAPSIESPNVRLVAADVSAATFAFPAPLDLITCVHGLHYLGDKLGFVERAYAALAPGGLLLAHLDPANLRFEAAGETWSRLVRRVQSVSFALRGHLLRIERGEAGLRFGAMYRGATVSESPNYTGMTVVDSWYALECGRSGGDAS